MSSCSSSVAALTRQIEALSDFNPESSQNVSDLLAELSSTPSAPSSPIDSDSHLLDFLNDRQSCITPTKKRDTSDLLSSPGESFDFGSPGSTTSVGSDSDVRAFLAAFNSKYDASASNLFDVFDLVDSMLARKQKTEPKCTVDPAHVTELRTKVANLQNDKDKMSAELASSSVKIETLEQEIQNLRSENAALCDGNNALERENQGLKETLDSMNQMMESQMAEMVELGEQRCQLIDLTRKQNKAIEEFEKISHTFVPPAPVKRVAEPVLPKKQETDCSDELYTLMCSVIRMADDVLPETATDRLHAIRDDSRTPLRERILQIVKSLLSQIVSSTECAHEAQGRITSAENCAEKYQRKCREILSVVEEELTFLQTLTHSRDLQAAVFMPREACDAPLMNEESKNELIRRCALIGRFIEETIGTISPNIFDEQFTAQTCVDQTHIFELLQTTTFQEKLSTLIKRIENTDDVDVRQLFDLLIAQVFINDLMKNHASELHMRMAHCNHEINTLRQEIDDNGEELEQMEAMRKVIKKYKHRENRLKRFISNYVEVDDQLQPVELVQKFLDALNEKLENCGGFVSEESASEVSEEKPKQRRQSSSSSAKVSANKIEHLAEELQRKTAELDEAKQRLEEYEAGLAQKQKEAIDKQTRELQDQLNNIKNKLHTVVKQSEEQAKEAEKLQDQLITKTELADELQQKLSEMEKSMETEISELREKLEESQNEKERLDKQVADFESVLCTVKKERHNLGSQIERLKTANTKLQESLDAQAAKFSEEHETEVKKISDELNEAVRERVSALSQVKVLTAKNQQLSSEISSLSIAKKSAELKLRAYDERMNMEKRNLQSQATAKVAAAEADHANKLAELTTVMNSAAQTLASFLPEEETPTDLQSVVAAVEDVLEKNRRTQYLYVELLDDVNEAQKMLGISTTAKISPVIRDIMERKATDDRVSVESEQERKQKQDEIEAMKKELNKTKGHIISLKQWEIWGRRVHGTIYQTDAAHMTSDELRVALEQPLLHSVSHRAIYSSVESLRDQKAILMKYDKRALMTKQPLRGGVRPLIAICMFARRMQKLAGCLPVPLARPPETAGRTHMRDSQEQQTPRRIRTSSATKAKFSRKSGCKSPLRPVIPSWI